MADSYVPYFKPLILCVAYGLYCPTPAGPAAVCDAVRRTIYKAFILREERFRAAFGICHTEAIRRCRWLYLLQAIR